MNLDANDPSFISHKQQFANFLATNEFYTEKITEMFNDNKTRLTVDLNHLAQEENTTLRYDILHKPMDLMPAWEEALQTYIQQNMPFMMDDLDDDTGMDNNPKTLLMRQEEHQLKLALRYKIGIFGNFGDQRLSPQQLLSNFIGTLVCIEGIVTKTSLIRPKVVETVHFCEITSEFHTQTYRDATAMGSGTSTSAYLTQDQDGNKLTTEFGLSTYINHQTVHIQDMPERTESGSMPQTVECILNADMVDVCKPGDRVQIIGIYRALSSSRSIGFVSGRFRTVVLVNNVRKIQQSDNKSSAVNASNILLSADDIRNIKKQSKKRNIFFMLSSSIIPSIFGHEFIKKALVLQLLGGEEKNLENGTHIRGDINILMVGDPSCGKSQLLRGVMNIAPLAINTTGRGSSGVGLTAAVTTDKESGVRRLEAGAMVLADRGIVCIDEFDKMSDIDRTAIHEVMEQQTVTIAKAGIHTSLNARCSVIAAANPVYGMYDRTLKPHINIRLPDSLLSRFDLLFIVLDKLDTEIDRNISDHVVDMHTSVITDRMRSSRDYNDIDMDDDVVENTNEDDVDSIYSKLQIYNKSRNRDEQLYNISFCKKYIEFAKKNYHPQLTDNASEEISQLYAELRGEDREQTLPITARCLETIIRLSTAHAKMRLKQKITTVDVRAAMKVLQYALTNDATPIDVGNMDEDEDEDMDDDGHKMDLDKRGGKQEDYDASEDENEQKLMELPENEAILSGRQSIGRQSANGKRKLPDDKQLSADTRSPKRLRIVSGDGSDNDLMDETVDDEVKEFVGDLDEDRVLVVMKLMTDQFRDSHIEQLSVDNILYNVKNNKKGEEGIRNISMSELQNMMKHLHSKNKLFLHQNMVHQL